MSLSLVYGHDAAVAAWVAARIPHASEFGPCVAIGVADGDRLIAGAVFHNYRGHDIEVSMAADNPRWASKRIIGELLRYPFVQLGCVRLTTITPADARRVRKFDRALGFQYEGRHPLAIDGERDAISYGMLREHAARWIGEAHG